MSSKEDFLASDVMNALETIFEHRAKTLPPEVFADLLDRLIWILADNGTSIDELQTAWLTGEDLEKWKVAIEMTEAYPFGTLDREVAVARLSAGIARWPETRDRYQAFLDHFWPPK